MRSVALFLFAIVAGCASAPRFADRPIVWEVDDRQNVPEIPKEKVFHPFLYMADIFLFERSTRALRLDDAEPATSTNALDEVPDSTWFTNRIGRRTMTPEEAAIGPNLRGDVRLPITVVSGKTGGGNPGFVAKDAEGRRYLVKFDTHDNPEMQTATNVIVNRILWTAGYAVPADQVFLFHRDDITLAADAKIKDAVGNKRAMTDADVDATLATAPQLSDGRYRATASELLEGKPIGGFVAEGTREDDPNDTIDHLLRRELRGLYALASWTNHTDMKEDNTLDMYVEEDGKHFVRHYLVDFGEALASHAAEKGRKEDGYEHFWDWRAQPLAFLALGLWKRRWEDLEPTPWLSVGMFEADVYEPDTFEPAYPWWPFMAADRADRYWGAKIVMRFDRSIVAAIVAEAKLSSLDAAAYLVDTLMKRREKIGRAWIESLTAFDALEIEDGQLCGVDLGIVHGLASQGVLESLDDDDDVRDEVEFASDGRACLGLPATPGYHVLRLRTRRDSVRRPVLQVHLRTDGAPRIVGVIRVEDDA